MSRCAGEAMDEIYEMPGHLVRRFQQISVAIFVSELESEGFDLTPVQYAALAMTRSHPGIDQATLAGYIAYDQATIGGVVDRLEHKELIVREVSRRDRRARELRLTPAGELLLDRVGPTVARVQEIMLRGLNPEESATFITLLHKATTAANQLSRSPLRPNSARVGLGTDTVSHTGNDRAV